MVNKCGNCQFFHNPKLCPELRGYGSQAKNSDGTRIIDIMVLPTDSPCKIFKSKTQLEMSEALTLLNQHVFKCPTDTEKVIVYKEGTYENAKPLIHTILEKNYGDELKRSFVEEAYAHLQRANYLKREQINQFICQIPLKNGLFNLNTLNLDSFTPEQIFTYKLNIEYDETAKCPKWQKFLKEVLPDKKDRLLLQEIAGYCLLPDMPFHKMFWFYGTGRNGKGVVVRTIEELLGKNNCSALNLSEFTEGRRFSLCRLYGKLLNVSSEPKLSKYGLQTTILKMVTGQDTIYAELKGKNERLQFTNFAKLIVLGNHFPKVEDNSLGWWERIEVLRFPNSFEGEKNIPNIEQQWIPEEIPGIFNWMMEGLFRLKEQHGFTKTKSAEQTKTEFMKVSDPFNAWMLENCVLIPNSYILREDALEDCNNYCDEIGADQISKRQFYEKMRNIPRVKDTAKKINNQSKRVFLGIALRSSSENEQSTLNNEKVAEVTEVADFLPQQSFQNNISKKKQVKNFATSATSETHETKDYQNLCKWVQSKFDQGSLTLRELQLKINSMGFFEPVEVIIKKLSTSGKLRGLSVDG